MKKVGKQVWLHAGMKQYSPYYTLPQLNMERLSQSKILCTLPLPRRSQFYAVHFHPWQPMSPPPIIPEYLYMCEPSFCASDLNFMMLVENLHVG